MFWGTVIKEGQPLKSQKVLETSEFAVLHLSAAIADKPSAKATRLYIKNAKDAEVIIANLNDKSESVVLDLYINCTQNVTLFVKGPSEVHLSGYFEPKGEDADDDMFYGQEGEEDGEDEDLDDEDSEEEVKPASGAQKAIAANLKQAQVNSAKNASAKAVINMDDDEESELEDDMGDEEDLEDLDDIDLDAEEEESEEEHVLPQSKQNKAAVASKPSAKKAESESESDDEDDVLADDISDSDEEEVNLAELMKKAKQEKEA